LSYFLFANIFNIFNFQKKKKHGINGGNTTFTIFGGNLYLPSTSSSFKVTVGGVAATNVTLNPGTSVTFQLPNGNLTGNQQVKLSLNGGTSYTTNSIFIDFLVTNKFNFSIFN
jgi:uncharacterized protein (TIGR03437 family)